MHLVDKFIKIILKPNNNGFETFNGKINESNDFKFENGESDDREFQFNRERKQIHDNTVIFG